MTRVSSITLSSRRWRDIESALSDSVSVKSVRVTFAKTSQSVEILISSPISRPISLVSSSPSSRFSFQLLLAHAQYTSISLYLVPSTAPTSGCFSPSSVSLAGAFAGLCSPELSVFFDRVL
jgi:hypothetical protein